MTFCPNTFCPNAYVSQKKVNCPKCQKSQLHFVPKAKCPNYILSQYPFVSWKSVPTPQIPIPFLTCKAILPVLMQDTVSPSELSQWLLLSRWIVPNTFCPQVNCPNDILSQCHMSQKYPKIQRFVPNTKCPKHLLSQKPNVPTTFCPNVLCSPGF